MFRLLGLSIVVSSIFLSAASQAALVTGPWTFNGTATGVLSNTNTASPVVGNNTNSSADNKFIDSPMSPVSLSMLGDKVVLSGMVTMSSIVSNNTAPDQFRWGLFNSNGSAADTGWTGYFMSNANNAGIASALRKRDLVNTGIYASGTGATVLASTPATSTAFADGTYNYNLTLEVVSTGISISGSLVGPGSYSQIFTPFVDTTSPYTQFNAVGFLIGDNLNADQVSFSNVDVTFTAVPEPQLLGIGLMLGCLAMVSRFGKK